MSDTSKFINLLQQKSNSISTISADFSEHIYSSLLKYPKELQGRLYFKQNSGLRWEIISPVNELIISNGAIIKHRKEGVEQKGKAIEKTFRHIHDLITMLINNSFINSNEFTIDYLEDDAVYIINLFPRAKKLAKRVKNIEMKITKSDLSISELKIVEASQNYLHFSFENVFYNQEMNNKLFSEF